MFNFDKFQNFVLGSLVVVAMTGCQSSGSDLYEELVQQDMSLGEYLEEQDGSLEEWEDSEKKVAMKIEQGDYELVDQGLLADNSGEGLVDPMAGAFGDWGEAPEEIADVEVDSSIVADEATTVAFEASKKVRLGKLEAGKDSIQEQAPVLTGRANTVGEAASSQEEGALDPADMMSPDAGKAEQTNVQPTTILEDEDYHLRDLNEQDSLGVLLGGEQPTAPAEEWLEETDDTDVSADDEEVLDDSLSDSAVVSEGVFVTITEPRRFASPDKSAAGWLEETPEEQDSFLAALIGEERDVESWDEMVPEKEPGFDIEELELLAFDLPDKMDVDLEQMVDDVLVYKEDMLVAFATARNVPLVIESPEERGRTAVYLASAVVPKVKVATVMPSATASAVMPSATAATVMPSAKRVRHLGDPQRSQSSLGMTSAPSVVRKAMTATVMPKTIAATVMPSATRGGHLAALVNKVDAPTFHAVRRYPFKEQDEEAEPLYWHDRRMKVLLQKRIRIETC